MHRQIIELPEPEMAYIKRIIDALPEFDEIDVSTICDHYDKCIQCPLCWNGGEWCVCEMLDAIHRDIGSLKEWRKSGCGQDDD